MGGGGAPVFLQKATATYRRIYFGLKSEFQAKIMKIWQLEVGQPKACRGAARGARAGHPRLEIHSNIDICFIFDFGHSIFYGSSARSLSLSGLSPLSGASLPLSLGLSLSRVARSLGTRRGGFPRALVAPSLSLDTSLSRFLFFRHLNRHTTRR